MCVADIEDVGTCVPITVRAYLRETLGRVPITVSDYLRETLGRVFL